MIDQAFFLPIALLAGSGAQGPVGAPPSQASAIDEAKAAKPAPGKDAIVVTGRRPAVERNVEGTSYDVRGNAQGQAGSAADLLNTIPSVNVSPDGAVTVRGNSNVQVYVNGRPSAAMNGESRGPTLQSMSGGSIASVEVITNPSARFDANGGAILNIVLKKAEGQGLRGTARANAGDRGRKSGSLNASYGRGKVSASLDASLRQDIRFTHISDDRRLFGADGLPTAHFVTVSRYTPTRVRSANASGSLGYALTPKANLGLDLAFSEGSLRNRVDETHVDQTGSDAAISEYRRIRGGTYVQGSSDVSAYYDRTGGKDGSILKLVAQHSSAWLHSDRLFTTLFDIPPLAPAGERVLNRTLTRINRAAIDHERPIGSGLRLGVGAEWKRELSRIDNGRGPFDPGEKDPGPVRAPVRFAAVERTAAAYASLQFRSGPWTVLAGERFEDLRIATDFAPGQAQGLRRLDGFNHSLSASREIGDAQAIFRLSRSRQRFDPQDLNPAIVYVDAQNRHSGNPLLSPQDVTSAEAEYSSSHDGSESTATLYYRRTDQTIADFSRFLADDVLITTKRNNGRSQAVGGELSWSGKIGKAIKYSVTGNVFYAELSASGLDGVRRESLLSYTGQASIDWSATAKDDLHVDANLQGPSLIPQGRRTGTGAVNLVWRHRLAAKWTASLNAQGLVHDYAVHSVLRTLGAIDVTDRRSGARSILLGLSYKIR